MTPDGNLTAWLLLRIVRRWWRRRYDVPDLGNPDDWPIEPVPDDGDRARRNSEKHRDPGDRERLAGHEPGWFRERRDHP
jgi:hypothetical protein